MPLNCVTITGADDSTDPMELLELWREFQFVEWGILVGSNTASAAYSPEQRARIPQKIRFPSIGWIHKIAYLHEKENGQMRLSLHACGKFLDAIREGSYSGIQNWIGSPLSVFDRVQLNWHGEKQLPEVGEQVLNTFSKASLRGWEPELVFQLDGINDDLWRPAARKFVCTGLFDRSHGAGVLADKWPKSLTEIGCGWAGGLGPQNLTEEIQKITEQSCKSMNFWIDMETWVRTDDGSKLDLNRVRQCLQIAKPFIVT